MDTPCGDSKRTQGQRRFSHEENQQQRPIFTNRANTDFQGGAGHGQLKFGEGIRMKHQPQTLTPDKDLDTSPRRRAFRCFDPIFPPSFYQEAP